MPFLRLKIYRKTHMTKYSVKKPLTIIVSVIVVIALGVVSFGRLTPDLLPSIDLPYVMIMTTYPGATPEEVQEEVTKPLEQSLATVENMKTLMSSSSPSYSLVMVEFENGTSMDSAVVDVLQQVDLVEGSWGDNIGAPYILKLNPTMIPIMVAAVDREGYDLEELSEFTTQTLTTPLEGTTGVASVRAGGLLESQINVLIDSDKVDVTNINRQIIALNTTVGRSKAELMKERALMINPEIRVTSREVFFGPDNREDFDFASYDYVVDAIDSMTSKIELIVRAKESGTPVISAMGAGNKLDPTAFRVADIYETSVCPLAKILRKELRKRDIDSLKVVYSTEPAIKATGEDGRPRRTPGSVSFVPSVMGLIMAGEVVKDLTKDLRE